MKIDRDRIQAHRGASGRFPENTLLAFRAAQKAGVASIETDLSLLADGALAIFHDAVLGRTVAGSAAISELKTDEMARLDAGSWRGAAHAGAPVPLMRDILDWQETTDLAFNWEMKIHGDEQERAAAALAGHLTGRDLTRSLVSSFDAGFLNELMSIFPALPRALICDELPADWERIGRDLDLTAFHLHHVVVTGALVQAVHDAGYMVRVYTVNEQADMARMIEAGVDVIITDYPERWL
ncbi:MAG: glycerophosphodiester phosphodiesterase family protein [Pseudomonadota bacterium]|nr:glycerophosphodiester phosphodiesterase family protein [Pseudomonadota bacterium]